MTGVPRPDAPCPGVTGLGTRSSARPLPSPLRVCPWAGDAAAVTTGASPLPAHFSRLARRLLSSLGHPGRAPRRSRLTEHPLTREETAWKRDVAGRY